MERPIPAVHLIVAFKWRCSVCNGRASIAIRSLLLNSRRFYCTVCAAALRKPEAQRPRKGNA